MYEKQIEDLTKDELLDSEFIPSIYSEYQGEERKQIVRQILLVAKDKKILTPIKKALEKEEKVAKMESKDGSALLYMSVTDNDKVEVTIDNYVQAILNTPRLKDNIFYNEFSGKFERRLENGHIKNWSDIDDAWLLNEIEKDYGVYEPRKCVSALNCCINELSYHPIKSVIEAKEWDGIPRIDDFLSKYMGCEDDEYSTQVSRMIFYGGIARLYNPGCKFDYMPIFIGEQGCVDCDTEYFTGTEWKKISEYKEGDKVLQYNKDGSAELVYPINYIKQQKDILYHFNTKYGIDQCLSENHNVYYITSKNNLYHKTMKEVMENHEKSSFGGRFITAFKYNGKGIDLSNDMIRVMCMVFADGSFYSNTTEKRPSYNTCRFHLKKERKKQRLLMLCEKAGINVIQKPSKNEGYTDFYIKVPFRAKHFPKEWYNCTNEQLQIITDEVPYWDGRIDILNEYCTTCKEDADFIQFAYNSTGRNASIRLDIRKGEKYKAINDEYYIRKSNAYYVHWSKEYLKTLNHSKENKTKIEEYKTKDGYEYCFTVPSGILVLRRNNCVFVTGNCGKSSMVNWLNIDPKVFREIVTIEGKDSYDILRYGWICEFPELLAMVKHQTNEAMKAYVTRQVDSFRPAYGRNYIDIPRHCIFIGTTNTYEFLTDNDNRRYLPIVINTQKGEIFKKEKEVKEYILKCWQEAKYLLDNNKIYLTIPEQYNEIVEKHRDNATEDDPEFGVIGEYLQNKEIGARVCALDIFTEAMGKLRKNYSKMNSRYITNVMLKFKNWKRSENNSTFGDFGRQRYWEKESE